MSKKKGRAKTYAMLALVALALFGAWALWDRGGDDAKACADKASKVYKAVYDGVYDALKDSKGGK